MKVVALVPAHNEQDNIRQCIAALQAQTYKLADIVVVADNCSDDTKSIAESMGAFVYETKDNVHKKAGALNQVLDVTLPHLSGYGILVVDADSWIDPQFVEHAVRHLAADKNLGGVGGTFVGREGGGFVGMLQRNEYVRYRRDTQRKKGKVLVLTGTAAVFPAESLQSVVEARREGSLPGEPHVYDISVLTEDNELSLALQSLGYKIKSPKECTLTTEVMESWGDLYRQRLRWKRGAVENILDYGINKVTLEYWARQLLSVTGIYVTLGYMGSVVWSLIAIGQLMLHPIWIAVTLLFALERMITVRERGIKQMIVAGFLFIEMIFDLFLQAVHAVAFKDVILATERKW